MQKRHIDNDALLFVTALISLVVTAIVIYILCRHIKLKSLVTSIALQQIRGTDVVSEQEHDLFMNDTECTYKTQWYTIATLGLVISGIIIFVIIHARKLKPFRGHLFP